MLFYGSLFVLLPTLLVWGFMIATFVCLIQLWQETRRVGFGILAALLLVGQSVPLITQKIGGALFGGGGIVIGLFIGAAISGLTYWAWRDIRSYIRARTADA